MSAADPGHDLHGVPEKLRTFAEWKLEPQFDDDDCPEEVTIFNGEHSVDKMMTHWITMDYAHVWPMEDCR